MAQAGQAEPAMAAGEASARFRPDPPMADKQDEEEGEAIPEMEGQFVEMENEEGMADAGMSETAEDTNNVDNW